MSEAAKEILRYELDVSDVEAKAKRMLQLTEQIRTGSTKGQDVSSATEELKQLHYGFDRVGQSTKRARDAMFDFDNKGEKVVKGVLATMSPQLASAADMAIDLAQGFTKLTPSLLAVAAVGVGVAAIANAMARLAEHTKQAADEQERLNKAIAEVDARSVEDRTSTAERVAKLGIDPAQTDNVLVRMQGLAASGVRRELAFTAAAGESLLYGTTGKPLTADESNSLLAGLASDPSATLSGNRQKDIEMLRRAMNVGKRPEVREFAGNLFNQTAAKAMEEAPTTAEIEAARLSGGLASSGPKRAKRDHPDLSDRDFKKLERLLAGESEASVFGTDDAPPGLRPGTDRTVEQLMRIVEEQRGRFDETPRSAEVGERPAVINNTFIGSAYFGGGNALRNPNFDSPVHSPGGGLHRNGVE